MSKLIDFKLILMAVVMMFVVKGVANFIDNIPGENYLKKVPIISTVLSFLPFYFFLLAARHMKQL